MKEGQRERKRPGKRRVSKKRLWLGAEREKDCQMCCNTLPASAKIRVMSSILNPAKPENTFWFVGQKRMGGQSMTDWKIHNKCSSLYICCWTGLACVGNDTDWFLNYCLRRLASLQIPAWVFTERFDDNTAPLTGTYLILQAWNVIVFRMEFWCCLLRTVQYNNTPCTAYCCLFRSLIWNKIKYQWQICLHCMCKNVSYCVIFLSFQSIESSKKILDIG